MTCRNCFQASLFTVYGLWPLPLSKYTNTWVVGQDGEDRFLPGTAVSSHDLPFCSMLLEEMKCTAVPILQGSFSLHSCMVAKCHHHQNHHCCHVCFANISIWGWVSGRLIHFIAGPALPTHVCTRLKFYGALFAAYGYDFAL